MVLIIMKSSIDAARNLSQKEGLDKRVEFAVVSANESIDNDFDLVAFFDCLHDMADPIGALKFAKQSLKSRWNLMIIEPMANDNIEDNLIWWVKSIMQLHPSSVYQIPG